MYRLSSKIIGLINLFTLVTSIPIIWFGLHISKNNTTCLNIIQTPFLVLGFIILIVSIIGFIGACFDVPKALWVYLVLMLLVIVCLIIVTVFGFVITGQGGGGPVPGRVYKEYHSQVYSNWLRTRVKEVQNWNSLKSCIFVSKTCDMVANWTPVDYMKNDMTPVKSGCCKPPTACTYGQPVMMNQDPDCYKWNNDPSILCYNCDSCKAGVLESIRRDWHKLSMINVIILIVLICVYSVGCCAFQNTRRVKNNYPFGHYFVNKFRPGGGFY